MPGVVDMTYRTRWWEPTPCQIRGGTDWPIDGHRDNAVWMRSSSVSYKSSFSTALVYDRMQCTIKRSNYNIEDGGEDYDVFFWMPCLYRWDQPLPANGRVLRQSYLPVTSCLFFFFILRNGINPEHQLSCPSWVGFVRLCSRNQARSPSRALT